MKVSFCRRAGSGGARVVSSTVVHMHNRLGGSYMRLVKPFHKRIVPALLARERG